MEEVLFRVSTAMHSIFIVDKLIPVPVRPCPSHSELEAVSSALKTVRSSVAAQDAPSMALHCKVGLIL